MESPYLSYRFNEMLKGTKVQKINVLSVIKYRLRMLGTLSKMINLNVSKLVIYWPSIEKEMPGL